MRIAIVSESFLPNVNGVTNSVLRVLEHLKRNGHDAIVIAPGAVGDEVPVHEYEGFPVLHVPAVMVPMVTSLPVGLPQPWITEALREFDPDVIHLASPFLLGAGGIGAARRLGVPAVAIFQTDVAGFADSYGLGLTARAAWGWTRRIHRACDRTLAPSSASVRDLEKHGVPRVHRWGRGVDIERFSPTRRDGELREQWTPEGKLIVGFVGRLAPEKHVERLAVLSGRDDVQVVIVGDGPDRPKLQRLMLDAVFTGQLGGLELARAYASFDMFVHTGEHETFCQAIQEALASGIPVIGPDAGGPKDLIAHARTGFLLPVPSFEEVLPGAVETFLDPMARSQFGRAARRSVLQRTWPAICDELLGHYADAAGIGAAQLPATA
ncbi:glycosyltransferase family 4 protein [Lolliginicoccus suaedae]|uniref:glycosyltransferase family 4 protein n=1 Tax=Lolliginicoccus suaedae TaxID=2605429 RepID=UPI0011EC7A81|nr:glycosyltransferase family 1 protein [Lolliginicoccus suaedae]